MPPRLGPAVLAAVALLALPGSGLADPQWQAATELAAPSDSAPTPSFVEEPRGFACGAPGTCVAVGNYAIAGGQRAWAATAAGGAWSAASALPLPGDAGGTGGAAVAVSCPAAHWCAAMGVYETTGGGVGPLVVVLDGGSWSAVATALPGDADPAAGGSFGDGACGSPGQCSGVGSYQDAPAGHTQALVGDLSGTTAATRTLTLPADAAPDPTAQLGAVACPAAGECTAVGTYATVGGPLPLVVQRTAAGGWGTGASAPMPADYDHSSFVIRKLRCVAPGECIASGVYSAAGHQNGLLLRESGGTWSAQGTDFPAGATSVALRDGACTASDACVAVGSYHPSGGHEVAATWTEAAGAWGGATALAPPADAGTGDSELAGIACPAAGACRAVGSYIDGGGTAQLFVAHQLSGAWGAPTRIAMPANAHSSLNPFGKIACPSIDSCGLTGYYYDAAGRERSFGAAPVPTAASIAVVGPGTGTTGTAIAADAVTATITSAVAPTGDVTFRVFGPQDAAPTSCDSGGTALGTGGGATSHPSGPFTPAAAGRYWWYARYAGDDAHQPAGAVCGATMPVTTVASASSPGPSLTPTPTPTPTPKRPSIGGAGVVTCPAGGAGCTATGTWKQGRVVVARRTLRIAAGHRAKVTPRLTKAGRRRLAHHRALHARRTLIARAGHGSAVRSTVAVTLRRT